MEIGKEMDYKIFIHDRCYGKKLEEKVEWDGMEYIMNKRLEILINIFQSTFHF